MQASLAIKLDRGAVLRLNIMHAKDGGEESLF